MQHEIILETPRLLLRKKVVEDAPFFFDLNSDPLVTQYTGDGAFKDLKGAEDIVKYVIGQYEKNGYGRWLVAEKESGEPLGWCGLKFHDDTNETDIGYRFMQKYWGKGYATESAKACIDYGFSILKLKRIIGNAMEANTASIHVFKKLGMSFVENNLLHDVPSVTYDIKYA
ncbi:MAG: GNAT family N-acetyltransferase [Bacteroidota bacterium]